MIIDEKWVTNYIKEKGTRIIIPKEATEIESFAFDNQEENLEIIFEEGSKLEKIKSRAFVTEISNTIMLPPSIKHIEEYAFYGHTIPVRLPEDSQIETCDCDFVFIGQKDIEVPKNVEHLNLSSIVEHLDSLTIPQSSKLKKVTISSGVDKVKLPNETELLSTEEKTIGEVRLDADKAMILYYQNGEYIYEIINSKDKSVLYNRKYL